MHLSHSTFSERLRRPSGVGRRAEGALWGAGHPGTGGAECHGRESWEAGQGGGKAGLPPGGDRASEKGLGARETWGHQNRGVGPVCPPRLGSAPLRAQPLPRGCLSVLT